MSPTQEFDIHEYECVSLDKNTRTLSIQVASTAAIVRGIFSPTECNLIAAFIDLANDENGTGYASSKDMANLLGLTPDSFEVRLSQLRPKLKEMVLIPPHVTADSLFLSTILRGKIPFNAEKKPFEFNTMLAYALKEGLDIDGIRTESQKIVEVKTNPEEFYAHVEEIKESNIPGLA